MGSTCSKVLDNINFRLQYVKCVCSILGEQLNEEKLCKTSKLVKRGNGTGIIKTKIRHPWLSKLMKVWVVSLSFMTTCLCPPCCPLSKCQQTLVPLFHYFVWFDTLLVTVFNLVLQFLQYANKFGIKSITSYFVKTLTLVQDCIF